MKKMSLQQVKEKSAQMKEFIVKQYGVHTADVVQKHLDLAMAIQAAKDLDTLLNVISSTRGYPKFGGMMVSARANGKSAVEVMQHHFLNAKEV